MSFTPDNAGAYLYVCQKLLNRPPATQRCFYAFLEENGFKDDILAVRFISKAHLKELTFTDPDSGLVRNIMPYDYGKLVMWKEYTVYRAKQGRKLKTAADVLSIDPDEFEEWTEDYLINGLEEPRSLPSSPVRPTASNTTPSTTATSRTSVTPTELFKRGIKRDPSLFPVMKQDSQFRQWKLHTISLAKAQDCGEIIDGSYVPKTVEESALFQQKQIYMYSVFCHTLLTNVGLKLVRDHEHTNDAQAVFRSFIEHYTGSVIADLDQAQLMEYVTTIRLGESGPWKGTYYSFVLHFQEQLRKLDDLQDDPGARFSPEMRKILLQNAVRPVPELHSIQTTAEQLITSTGSKQPYETYVALLTTAAQRIDGTTPSTRARRSANLHEQFAVEQDMYDDLLPGDGEEYDVNSPVEIILANAHARLPKQQTGANPSSRLSEEIFRSLSREGKQAWISLSAEDKLKILGKTPVSTSERGKPALDKAEPKTEGENETRSVNLHNMSAADYLALQQHFSEKLVTTEKPTVKFEESNSAVVPYKPVGRLLNPKNATTASGSPSTKTYSANSVSISPADPRFVLKKETQDNSGQIIINGKPYKASDYSINLHEVVYNYTTCNNLEESSALIDRGSNGGIAGKNVRIISFHSDIHANIGNIGNTQQFTNLPLVTAGGVVTTSNGPAIIVLPFYAYTGEDNTIICPNQLEYYGNNVDDRCKANNGKQSITTASGIEIPLTIQNGLARLLIRPFTDEEFSKLPTIMLASDTIPWNPSILDDKYSNAVAMLSNDQDNNSVSGIEWSFDIWGDIPDYEGDLNEDIMVFSPPDVKTTIPTVSTPSFVFTPDQCTTSSETNGEPDLDKYPDGKVFKNHEDFLCQLSFSFELLAQFENIMHFLSIPEEPPVLLPPPEPPPFTFVSLTTITTKWGDTIKNGENAILPIAEGSFLGVQGLYLHKLYVSTLHEWNLQTTASWLNLPSNKRVQNHRHARHNGE